MEQQQFERLVGVRELEEFSGLPRTWWYQQAELGHCPSLKVGKYRRFRLSEIEKWLEAKRSR